MASSRRVILHIEKLMRQDHVYAPNLKKVWDGIILKITAEQSPLLGNCIGYLLSNLMPTDITMVKTVFNNGSGFQASINTLANLNSKYTTHGEHWSDATAIAHDSSQQLILRGLSINEWLLLMLIMIVMTPNKDLEPMLKKNDPLSNADQLFLGLTNEEITSLDEEEKPSEFSEIVKPYIETYDYPGMMTILKPYFQAGKKMTTADVKMLPDFLRQSVQELRDQNTGRTVQVEELPQSARARMIDEIKEVSQAPTESKRITSEDVVEIMRDAYKKIYGKCLVAMQDGQRLSELPQIPTPVRQLLEQVEQFPTKPAT